MTEEEFIEKMGAEEDLMNAFLKSPPLEVQRGGKRELLKLYFSDSTGAV